MPPKVCKGRNCPEYAKRVLVSRKYSTLLYVACEVRLTLPRLDQEMAIEAIQRYKVCGSECFVLVIFRYDSFSSVDIGEHSTMYAFLRANNPR